MSNVFRKRFFLNSMTTILEIANKIFYIKINIHITLTAPS